MVRAVSSLCEVQHLALATVCCLLALSLTACATGQGIKSSEVKGSEESVRGIEINKPARKQELLVLKQVISGGQLVTRLDPNGLPLPGEARGLAALVFPSALAVRGSDLYIADSGARKLYRFDTATQVMSVVPGEDVLPWTRMQVGPDRSLYVLDPARVVIRRYPAGGPPPRILGDPLAAASLDSFVIDEYVGGIVASDNLNHRLLVFNPLGGAGWPIGQAEEGELPSLGAMASDGRTVYAIDNSCACIVAIDESGRVSGHIGQGGLVQPQELAADRHGHIFVYDAANRTLNVFLRGNRAASYGAQALHFTEVSALAVNEDTLYIADGPGSQVLVFHIQASFEERESENR